MSRRVPLAWGALLVASAACGGGQTGSGVFSTSWDDDSGRSIEAVRGRVARETIPLGADVAVGVAGHASKLIGAPLGGAPRWTYVHPIDARPFVTGRVVVGSGGGEAFALDALTGKLLWARPTGGLALHGAGDDGTVTVVTLTGASGRGSTLLVVSHDGAVLRQIERPVEMGVPAVVNRVAFVPWNNQYVSAVDVSDGSEIGRVVLREVTSRAWTSDGELYFGELGMFRFDDHIKDASRGAASHLALPSVVLPGKPTLFRPASDPQRPVAGATDKVRLYARPTAPSAPLALDSGHFYATYFRLVMGLTADHGQIAWVHTHPSTVVGGAAGPAELVVCDESGGVTVLDASHGGALGATVSLGEPLESCVVSVDGFRPSGAARDPGSLLEQLRVALSDRDLQLDAGQSVLVRALGALPDEGATELLVALASDPKTPPGLLPAVRAALAGRTSGAAPMLAALGRRYDYLRDDVGSTSVGPLARALAAMKEHAAAPLLARRLTSLSDSDADVRDVAQALATLATPSEAPDLLQFFALYRAAPPEPEEIPQAVMAVAEALLRVGGPAGRLAVTRAAGQPSTTASVRAKLDALLDVDALQRGTPSMTPSSTSRE